MQRDIIITQIINEFGVTLETKATQLVRCSDCKYFITMPQGKCTKSRHGTCDIHCNGVGTAEVVKRDFFCGYGEK